MEALALPVESENLYNGVNEMAVQEISLNKIKLAKNSRLTVSDEDLSELMASIKEVGLLQPIGVVKSGSGYEICYGNRRFLAMSRLGRTKIPVIIHAAKAATDADIKNLTENIQRRNISLTEVGRYIDLLRKEGLSLKEVAVRLGVAASYVDSCLKAFREVPEEYRKDLEIRVSNKKRTPGKIPLRVATQISSAQKTFGLSATETRKLFEAAKTEDGFIPENVTKYAKAIKAGEKDFIKKVVPVRQVVVRFLMSETEYERLEREYIDDGPFKSVSALLAAILTGKKNVKVKLVNA